MNDFEKRLKELNMKDIEAPGNFEELMKGALDNAKEDKKRSILNKKTVIKVAGIFFAILIMLNIQSVSAYFKILLGYDEYFSFNSYIKELNDENKIQGINKEITFSDGKKIIIEGLLYDRKFIKVFAKELNAITETVEIEVVDGRGRESYDKRGANNSLYTVTTFLAGENLESVILQLSYKEEKIDCELMIDKDKIINSTVVSDMNDNIVVIDEIEVEINSLRISPLAIEVDYSVTSKNNEKVKEIQSKSNSFFNEGITVNVDIDSKYLNAKGGVIFNSIEEIEDGVRFSQQVYCNDPRIDKLKEVKLIISIQNSQSLKMNIKKGIDNTWINNDLFIESIDYEETGVEVQYWSRYYRNKGEVERKYSIQPINSLYVENRKSTKELLGEDYKEFYYSKITLMTKDFEGNDIDILVVENKGYDVKLKERTMLFKVK